MCRWLSLLLCVAFIGGFDAKPVAKEVDHNDDKMKTEAIMALAEMAQEKEKSNEPIPDKDGGDPILGAEESEARSELDEKEKGDDDMPKGKTEKTEIASDKVDSSEKEKDFKAETEAKEPEKLNDMSDEKRNDEETTEARSDGDKTKNGLLKADVDEILDEDEKVEGSDQKDGMSDSELVESDKSETMEKDTKLTFRSLIDDVTEKSGEERAEALMIRLQPVASKRKDPTRQRREFVADPASGATADILIQSQGAGRRRRTSEKRVVTTVVTAADTTKRDTEAVATDDTVSMTGATSRRRRRVDCSNPDLPDCVKLDKRESDVTAEDTTGESRGETICSGNPDVDGEGCVELPDGLSKREAASDAETIAKDLDTFNDMMEKIKKDMIDEDKLPIMKLVIPIQRSDDKGTKTAEKDLEILTLDIPKQRADDEKTTKADDVTLKERSDVLDGVRPFETTVRRSDADESGKKEKRQSECDGLKTPSGSPVVCKRHATADDNLGIVEVDNSDKRTMTFA